MTTVLMDVMSEFVDSVVPLFHYPPTLQYAVMHAVEPRDRPLTRRSAVGS